MRLMGRPFRFVRCAACHGRLALYEVSATLFSLVPGVPLRVIGAPLLRWIADEHTWMKNDDHDPDIATDWSLYAENPSTD